MMRFCRNCQIEVNVEPEHVDVEYTRGYEKMPCPFCGKETVDMDYCQCGNSKPADQEYCSDCYEDTEEAVLEIVDELKAKGFRDWQTIDLIGQVLDHIEDEQRTRNLKMAK